MNSSTATRALRLASRQRLPLPTTHHHHPLHVTKLTSLRALHTSQPALTKPRNPSPRTHPSHSPKPTPHENIGRKRFGDYDVAGKVFIVTGGAQGLGLTMAEALVEAGGKVYALDRSAEPTDAEQWDEAQSRVVPEWGGSLHYRQQDVSDTRHLDELIAAIAGENGRLDGVVAAAGVQQITPAVECTFPELNSSPKRKKRDLRADIVGRYGRGRGQDARCELHGGVYDGDGGGAADDEV
jgi:hypothetical protein